MQSLINNLMMGSDAMPFPTSMGQDARLTSISVILESAIYLVVAAGFIFCARKHRASIPGKFLGKLGLFALAAGISFWTMLLTGWPRIHFFVFILQLLSTSVMTICAAIILSHIGQLLLLRNPAELQSEITQRRHTERELRQIHAQLEDVIEQRTAELAEKSEEMEQFLNTVSHDLKSPIVTCAGLIGILREDIAGGHFDETSDLLTRIERSVIRMRQLIDALLNLSRIGRITFEIGEVDTLDMLLRISDDLEPRLKAAGVTLEIKDSLPRVNGDAHWLTEVFENLINNALKYGCDNPEPRIVVGSGLEGEEARIFVRDNGKGIDPDHHAQIFEPFRRLRSDREGSGMGLAIVARIIKMHGGRVWIESRVGKGATFWVALPAAMPKPNTITQHDELVGV